MKNEIEGVHPFSNIASVKFCDNKCLNCIFIREHTKTLFVHIVYVNFAEHLAVATTYQVIRNGRLMISTLSNFFKYSISEDREGCTCQ